MYINSNVRRLWFAYEGKAKLENIHQQCRTKAEEGPKLVLF